MGFHEKLRLLYVACTRARDHLVVSVHRKARNLGDDQSSWTHAELLWHAADAARRSPVRSRPRPACARCRIRRAAPPPDRATLAGRARRSAFARGRAPPLRRRHHAGASGRRTRRGRPIPAWPRNHATSSCRRGTRAATAPRSAGPCTRCSRPSTSPPAPASTTPRPRRPRPKACSARKPPSPRSRARAVASTTVQTASAHAHWRETYVAVPVEGLTLEGYVDLVYRDERGLVVVDYKTDASATRPTSTRRLDHYRIQGAAYALAVAEAVGEPVAACVFVFLDPDGAREVTITGDALAAAVAEVRALVAAERADPSPLAPGGVRRTLDSGRGVPNCWTREGRPLLRRVRCDRRPRRRRTGRVLRAARSRRSPVREDDLVRAVAPRDEQAGAPVVRLRQPRRRHDDALRRGPGAGEARRRAEGVHRRRARDRGPALLHATTASTTKARPGRCSRT